MKQNSKHVIGAAVGAIMCTPLAAWATNGYFGHGKNAVGNDEDDDMYPGAEEVCNGKDDDCDGSIDEEGATGCVTYYRDLDGDGWGTDDGKCLCGPEGEYTSTLSGDCDDGDSTIYPLAPEICGDLKDNNCDGQIDEDCPP